jgi:hypothetical protein
MEIGNFYFLHDTYFEDFPDPQLFRNKESTNGQTHERPCFFSFSDSNTKIHWMIPFSSNVGKYKQVYNNKVKKRGKCDTIRFGYVLGYEKAFLIQNMCPITEKYINNEYMDQNTIPVRVDGALEQELISVGKKVLALVKRGVPLIFPDVLSIEKKLLEMIRSSEQVAKSKDGE